MDDGTRTVVCFLMHPRILRKPVKRNPEKGYIA